MQNYPLNLKDKKMQNQKDNNSDKQKPQTGDNQLQSGLKIVKKLSSSQKAARFLAIDKKINKKVILTITPLQKDLQANDQPDTQKDANETIEKLRQTIHQLQNRTQSQEIQLKEIKKLSQKQNSDYEVTIQQLKAKLDLALDQLALTPPERMKQDKKNKNTDKKTLDDHPHLTKFNDPLYMLLSKKAPFLAITISAAVIIGLLSAFIFVKFSKTPPAPPIPAFIDDDTPNRHTQLTDSQTIQLNQNTPPQNLPMQPAADPEIIKTKMYFKPAKNGNPHAMYKLAMAYLNGRGIEKDIDKAIQWLIKAGQNGSDDAKLQMGMMYFKGNILQKDDKKALKMFIEAAQAQNKLAMYNAARIYHQQKDPRAIQWYQKAAQKGLTSALNQLAQMHFLGNIAQKDLKKAFYYYSLAAEQKDINAMYNLGVLYLNGIGTKVDHQKAMKWLLMAAEQGEPESMYQIALIYHKAKGVEMDLETAIYWYQKAAKAGSQKAEKQLAELNKNLN